MHEFFSLNLTTEAAGHPSSSSGGLTSRTVGVMQPCRLAMLVLRRLQVARVFLEHLLTDNAKRILTQTGSFNIKIDGLDHVALDAAKS